MYDADEIRRSATNYLQPDRKGTGFICPICGSGTGENGTGITTKDGIHFTCWAGCFEHSDIIDIIGQEKGLTDFKDKLEAAAKCVGARDTSYRPVKKENVVRVTPKMHLSGYFDECKKRINLTDYHRGLSADTLEHFNVGYDAEWRYPKELYLANAENRKESNWEKLPTTKRLIIPTGPESYVARLTEKGDKKSVTKLKVGRSKIFNLRAMYESEKPIFVCEGEIDAMSFYEIGYNAVGLGSISNVDLLLREIDKQKPMSSALLVALDNDENADTQERVKTQINKLIAGLNERGITGMVVDVYGDFKDANDALNGDRDAFKENVGNAEAELDGAIQEKKDSFDRRTALYSLDGFWEFVEKNKNTPAISTGWKRLDKILDGGLYPGLYFIGAISSLGKTTFTLQLGDAIASSGRDVLFISLEMSKYDLIAKSLSRLTSEESMKKFDNNFKALTTREILNGKKYTDGIGDVSYTEQEAEILKRASDRYKDTIAGHIQFIDGTGYGVEAIRNVVAEYYSIKGVAPVVIVDYVQILKPLKENMTDKQAVDDNVVALKQISRDYDIPVIGISSFNRESYTSAVSMTAFKESGSVEYSSDILIGLQYNGMNYEEDESSRSEKRISRIRKLFDKVIENTSNRGNTNVDVVVLKNRTGTKGQTVLNFNPAMNRYTEPVREDEGMIECGSRYKKRNR